MRPANLCLPLAALWIGACTSLDVPQARLQIEPVLAIRHGGPTATAYYQLGRYYQGQMRDELAEAAYGKALALEAGNVDVLNALGSLYAGRGELARAMTLYEQLVGQAPESAYLLNNLAYVEFLQGRTEDAYEHLRIALVHDPAYDRAWSNLAKIAAILAPNPALISALQSRQVAALPPTVGASPPDTADNGLAAAIGDLTFRPETDLLLLETASQEANATLATAPAPTNTEKASGADRSAHAGPACPPEERASDPVAYRLEIANGNGVTGFAKRFAGQLRQQQLQVARITNFRTYLLPATRIEYQPGYAAAACAVLGQIGMDARLGAAPKARPGSDIRIVLGRDALQSTMASPKPPISAAKGRPSV